MDEWPEIDVAETFLRVAQDIGRQPSVAAACQRIVELLHKSTGCAGSTLWRLDAGGRLVSQAATNPELIAGVQDTLNVVREGICWQCLIDRETVRSNDLSREQRWPRYVAFVTEHTSVRSAVGIPLGSHERPLGSLSLYSEETDFFTGRRVQAATILAAHAGLALEKAQDAERADNLEKALSSNRRIGIAIGVLMAAHRITDEAAFDLLRVTSQHNHVKLREVADYVVDTGELPGLAAPRL